ncbi:hypothetical protein UT300005_16900 [Clostridium sp. CTA-5]
MGFLDEKIAALQKQSYNLSKYNELEKDNIEMKQENNISKLSQDEVNLAIRSGTLNIDNLNLIFENIECFEGKVTIPMIKDFFDNYQEDYGINCWEKKHELSVLLIKTELNNQNDEIGNLIKELNKFYEENNIYVEIIEEKEEENESYTRFIVSTRMPTALDYMYQYYVCVNYKNESIMLLFTCLEKDKKQWEKIMIGIGELMEIKEESLEINEVD